MPRKANENEKSRNLFIMKRNLESILQPTAGCFTDSWIYYWKRRAKTPSRRTKNEENCKYSFSAERRIRKCIEHAILWLSVLTGVQMPRSLLLLQQLMTDLLALHLVIWQQLQHGTIVSAVEIMHDLIKHASTQTWMMNLIRMKPITAI